MGPAKPKINKISQRPVEEQYEEGQGTDDEMPEVVSNASMKSSYDQLSKRIQTLKQQMKVAEKAKRRKKQEFFVEQKKARTTNKNSEEAEDTNEKSVGDLGTDFNLAQGGGSLPTKKPIRKVYPDLNITVEPLTKIDDSRASAALDFKSRRLAKVHRESVKTAVISYQKKLQTRK